MRSIKFRVWDKLRKEYLKFDMAIAKDGAVFSIFDEYLRDEFTDEVIVEQSIGLKDGSGTEIYEGDIVESGLKCPRIFVISWSEGDAAFVAGSQKIFYVAKRGKILGNIHENPELLETD